MTIKTISSKFFAISFITLMLTGCPPSQPKVCQTCVDFEPPLALGKQYGAPAGQNSGDAIFTTNGIKISVYDYNVYGSGTTFGFATIETAPTPFGSGQCIRTGNINLEFDFRGLGFQTSEVQFEFLDFGGYENISVNGSSPIFVGELSSVPSPVGGVSINVFTSGTIGDLKGVVILRGAVQTLRIGGAEFLLDNVCAK